MRGLRMAGEGKGCWGEGGVQGGRRAVPPPSAHTHTHTHTCQVIPLPPCQQSPGPAAPGTPGPSGDWEMKWGGTGGEVGARGC